ncbi:MAG: Hsp20/alpha crystallin family protein [Alphaproteobacteria bacterium]|nr:Hsp20/alpha crystallin family protein [Alphaproteobacteria bacterium]MBV8412628.1 Hsp20/alpha crystallin family protein [Alphaproteobacteria bacterium]
MALMFQDPFETLLQFQQSLDQLRSSDWLQTSPSGGGSYPPLNVFRKGDDIIIIAEVPGVPKQDLHIEAKGKTIRIAGAKNFGADANASIHRRERRGGQFDRAITLPIEIDSERIKAECRDGILAIYLPRAESDRPRSIAIT